MASQVLLVKELRERTGAGVMDCKEALESAQGDIQGAVEYLRKKGLADAAKKAHRESRDGVVASYIHPGSRIGVLVEINCETDFVARTDEFQQLVRDVAMQVAAASPGYSSNVREPGNSRGETRLLAALRSSRVSLSASTATFCSQSTVSPALAISWYLPAGTSQNS